MQCIPVDIELHDGTDEVERLKEEILRSTSQTQIEAKNKGTSISRMIRMIANFVRSKGQKAIILLDAFFESGDAFNTAEEEADNVTLIMRAKGNTVAFELPEQPKKRGRGRPRKYGNKVVLSKLFDEAIDAFS